MVRNHKSATEDCLGSELQSSQLPKLEDSGGNGPAAGVKVVYAEPSALIDFEFFLIFFSK